MSNRRIIIPKGLVDNPEQNSIVEISSRLNESKGDLIAKRQGKKLIAQQLPDWQDELSSHRVSRNNENTFIASPPGCPTTPPRPDETFNSNPLSSSRATNNTTYYSHNATDATSFWSAISADLTTETCYRSALEQTPSRARLNITGNDLAMNAAIESNVQMSDSMMANILSDTRLNINSTFNQPKEFPDQPAFQTFDNPADSSWEGSPTGSSLTCPGKSSQRPPTSQTYPLPTARSRQVNQTHPMAANETRPSCPCSRETSDDLGFDSNMSYDGFQPPMVSSPRAYSAAPGNQTFAPPGGQAYNATFPGAAANQTCPGSSNRSYTSPVRSGIPPTSPQTLPKSAKRPGRSRPGQDTFPRSANRSMLDTGSSRSPCSSPRDLPTDDSYDFQFQPWKASTMRSLSNLEDSSELAVDEYVSRNITPGKYNVITPMTPSPPRGGPGGCAPTCSTSPPNQTFAPSGGQAYNATFAGAAANQTCPGGLNKTSGSPPFRSGIPPTSPQTLPRAAKRVGRPRPGEDTFPRSANRSTLDTGSPCPCSSPRDLPTDDSYDFQFQPWQASTMRSLSNLEDSSELEVDEYVSRNITPGKYNVITPMTPSPPRGGPGGCAPTCSTSPPNQTFAPSGGQAYNATFAGAAANQTCPGGLNKTSGSPPFRSGIPPTSPQTLPRAAKRVGRPRPGEDTFPRSANRSTLDTGSPCPCSSPRDLPTDDSYDFQFQPWQASTMRSLSNLEDSSELEVDEYVSRNITPGKYNVITPMTPSPPRGGSGGCAPTCSTSPPNQTFAGPAASPRRKSPNQTMPRPPAQSFTRPTNETFAGSPSYRMAPNQTYAGGSSPACPGNQTFPGSPSRRSPGSRIPPTSPQTLPRAAQRSGRPRPGEDTFPRSANRSILDAGNSCSPSCPSPGDESFGGFEPLQASSRSLNTTSPGNRAECACAPDGAENVVSYTSQVFEDSYEED